MSGHAYRCAEPFAAVLRWCHEELSQFNASVRYRWNQKHPEAQVKLVPIASSLDLHMLAFLGGDTVPAGLIRLRDDGLMLPETGPAGDRWREAWTALAAAPSLDRAFEHFGAPIRLRAGVLRRWRRPDIVYEPDGRVYLGYAARVPAARCRWLMPVPWSELDAARAARDRVDREFVAGLLRPVRATLLRDDARLAGELLDLVRDYDKRGEGQ
jgi:hypothetical protein